MHWVPTGTHPVVCEQCVYVCICVYCMCMCLLVCTSLYVCVRACVYAICVYEMHPSPFRQGEGDTESLHRMNLCQTGFISLYIVHVHCILQILPLYSDIN